MIFYSLRKRTFLKADWDHLALTGQQNRRTQAGGALGGELKGKLKWRNKKKKQEGNDGEDREEDKRGTQEGGGCRGRGPPPKTSHRTRLWVVQVGPSSSSKGPALDGRVPTY